jgi:hypothetical protein
VRVLLDTNLCVHADMNTEWARRLGKATLFILATILT